MKTRLARASTSGQSLPLIALMIVLLFAMVGLSVDVGNTYAEQRSTVRASDAASLVGMNTVIRGGTDADVYNAIEQSLATNKIRVAARNTTAQPGERTLKAYYIDASGSRIADVGNAGSGPPPTGVTYVEVSVDGKVDTYFARIVGQQTLPVNAKSYAGQSFCLSGVYPFAVRADMLNQNGFIEPDARYSDDIYKNKTQKRIFLKDNTNPNGSFSWLRWLNDPQNGSAPALRRMLEGDGNLDEGYEEADWPENTPLPKPEVYPYLPGIMSVGDWLNGNAGLGNGGSVNELEWHIENRTLLHFPLFDADNGRDGINSAYHISGLEGFLVLGYGMQNQRDANGNKGWYIDLVSIGKAGLCPIKIPEPPTIPTPSIIGEFEFAPRYPLFDNKIPPVQYTIILDVSGSMSWNFAGQANSTGKVQQCTGVSASCGGAYWNPSTDRRIYIAKQAINSFIDQMAANDVMRIVTFSGNLNSSYSDANAISQLTKVWPTSAYTGDKAVLKSEVLKAGAAGGNYLTSGYTPSADGIARANQTIAAAPAQTSTSPKTEYKRVVIFLTDGVANVYKDGRVNTGGTGCGSEVASCQTGYNSSGVPKPIKAMALEAESLKTLVDGIYVIALAGVDETGLPDVATASNYPFYSKAVQGWELDGIFKDIRTSAKETNCEPKVDPVINTFPEDRLGSVSGEPLAYPTVGYVYLYDETGNPVGGGNSKVPILIDAQTGRMTYRANNIPQGRYFMEAYIAYKHGIDEPTHMYEYFKVEETQTDLKRISIDVNSNDALGTLVRIPTKRLDLKPGADVCKTN